MFARVPRLGQVKTRLARFLGDGQALAAYRELLENALHEAASVAVPRELCIDGQDEDGECARLAARFGFELTRQVPGDLGQRMSQALNRALAAGQGPAVLMGADCPDLTGTHIRWTFEALRDHDAVFVPVEDGGYCLVGLSRPVDCIFDAQMPWSSATVMTATRERLRSHALTWSESATLWDVDEPADWERWGARRG